MTTITTIAELEAIYDVPTAPATMRKVADHITADYAAFIHAAPFAVLGTVGPEGLDCSPRGDRPGFVRIADPRTLLLPDRRGNNRVDSLRNIVRDPRVALLFMVPGSGTTIRVNGRAHLSVDPDLLDSFAVEEKAPRSVAVIAVDEVYFQCARAIVRSELWNPERQVPAGALPTPGAILAGMTAGTVGGDAYDREWPGRAQATLW